MSGTFPFEVVDHKLQVGRGEEFSASRQREQQYADFETGQWQLPISHRVEDGLDTDARLADANTALAEDNVGFKMLQRMGWKGKGLGRAEQGLVEPVKGGVEAGMRLGVGKAEEDDHFTAAENVVRKRLDIEVAAAEDEDQAHKREMAAEREVRRRQEVSDIIRTFYCDTCHKQYNTAVELETHLSSYDHHHKKRLSEMRQATSTRTKHERGKREKRAADKEMARLNAQIQRAQQAAGVSAATPAAAAAPPPPPPGGPEAPPLPPPSHPPLPPTADIMPPLPVSDSPPPPPPLTDAARPSQLPSSAVPDWAPVQLADSPAAWGAPPTRQHRPPQLSNENGYPPAGPSSSSSSWAQAGVHDSLDALPAAAAVSSRGLSQHVPPSRLGAAHFAESGFTGAAGSLEPFGRPDLKSDRSAGGVSRDQSAMAVPDTVHQAAAAPAQPVAVQFGFQSGLSKPQQGAGSSTNRASVVKRPTSIAGLGAKRSKLSAPMAAFAQDNED
ncbi:hypothetical protein WJX74_008535 [Apatococcus lobatus]|uniref:G-patch domain-containing protein n=1 Tax=Apatococcus lobatus TaxID=904363 RepID=A0AAW1RX13_9CHLO